MPPATPKSSFLLFFGKYLKEQPKATSLVETQQHAKSASALWKTLSDAEKQVSVLVWFMPNILTVVDYMHVASLSRSSTKQQLRWQPTSSKRKRSSILLLRRPCPRSTNSERRGVKAELELPPSRRIVNLRAPFSGAIALASSLYWINFWDIDIFKPSVIPLVLRRRTPANLPPRRPVGSGGR